MPRGNHPGSDGPEADPIARILAQARVVAVIGWSPDPRRPSHWVSNYLARAGYRVVPINPNAAAPPARFARLDEVPGAVDLVVIFRRSEDALAHVEEAIRKGAGAVWLQEGVVTDLGAALCRAAGVDYVEDRCVMVEHERRS